MQVWIIAAESGQTVTLPCQAPNNNNNNIMSVEWSRADLETQYVLLYQDGKFLPGDQHPSFKDRVDLQDTQMKDGDVSLILKDLMTDDTGTYECRVLMRGTNTASWLLIASKDAVDETKTSHTCFSPAGGQAEEGSAGLSVGLKLPAMIVVALVVFVIYRKLKKRNAQSWPPIISLTESERAALEISSIESFIYRDVCGGFNSIFLISEV
uniref:Ig-like domain-containing protein n=1 Tax=Amphilophus citrinellus TaxID=61819 RepID=A0A3Q0QN82_AMPCI